jgi:hypothetical protein
MVKLPSVIVNDLDIPGISLIKPEAQTPLVVDAYAELTSAVALEKLQPVVRRDPQVFQTGGSVEHLQLALDHAFEVGPTCNAPTPKKLGRVFASECFDHGSEVFNATR